MSYTKFNLGQWERLLVWHNVEMTRDEAEAYLRFQGLCDESCEEDEDPKDYIARLTDDEIAEILQEHCYSEYLPQMFPSTCKSDDPVHDDLESVVVFLEK